MVQAEMGVHMAGEWKMVNLDEVASDVSYGYTESASSTKVGPHFLRITDIQNGTVEWSSVPYCPITKKDHEKYKLESGDIVIARTGNSTGENFLFQGLEDAVFASYLIRFRVDKQLAYPAFVWYNLRTKKWWDFIHNSKTGSAQAGANARVLAQYQFFLPPLPEQKRIAHILGTLDDKIELNRRMNATLEGMAQALFKSWFVDFDPVIDNALVAGNPIPDEFADRAEVRRQALADGTANRETAKHFPSALQLTEARVWIPEGWEVKSLETLIQLIGGGTPKTSVQEYWNGTIPWFSVVDAPNDSDVFVIDTDKKITQAGINNSSARILRVGTTIISARGTVGKCALVGTEMAMNQSCYGIQGASEIADIYTYYTIREFVADLQQRGHGSVFNTITRDTFKSVCVPFGSADLTHTFDKTVAPFIGRIRANLSQKAELTKLRDTLLPKLISGELRIEGAETMMEDLL
jgi:type I restriction enzyme S subunit